LYWLFFNRPSGDEFLNWDSDSCSVQINVKDDSLTRIRSKEVNRYQINDQNFDAVRTTVPHEIKEIINITETNIHLQDDRHFFLSQQPGEIATMLNQVVGITNIDSSLQYVNRIVTKQRTAIKFIENEIKQKQKELTKYKKLKKIEKIHRNYQNKLDSLDELENKIERIQQIKKRIKSFDAILAKESLIKKLASKLDIFKQILNKKEKINQEKIKLTRVLTTLSNAQRKLTNLSKEKERHEIHFKEMKKELKVCPLCEQPFAK